MWIKASKGILQNLQSPKLGTLSKKGGGGLPKWGGCPNLLVCFPMKAEIVPNPNSSRKSNNKHNHEKGGGGPQLRVFETYFLSLI